MASKGFRRALVLLLRSFWSQNKELRILVTGKTGQGKSSLVNGILGANVAKEGATAKRVTTEVEVFSKIINDVPIKVFDSPGLQDRTANEEAYIRGMKYTCKELSLVLYCTKMINTRLTDDDKYAMMKLTRAFGENFWNYAVFVLTFANMEDVSRRDGRDDPNDPEPHRRDKCGWKELGKRRFQGRLKLWEEELQRFLIEEVKVSPEIARGVPVVPTGDHKKSLANRHPFRLPDRDNWFIDFWKVCCLRVKETDLFLQVNSDRVMSTDNSSDEEDDDTPQEPDEVSSEVPDSVMKLKAAERFVTFMKKFEDDGRVIVKKGQERPPPVKGKVAPPSAAKSTVPKAVAPQVMSRPPPSKPAPPPPTKPRVPPMPKPKKPPQATRTDQDDQSSDDDTDSSDSDSPPTPPTSPPPPSSTLAAADQPAIPRQQIQVDDEFFRSIATNAINRNVSDPKVASEAKEALRRMPNQGFNKRMYQKTKK